jgi:hypothetical protein
VCKGRKQEELAGGKGSKNTGMWLGEKASKTEAARHGEREARIAEGCRMHMAYTAKKYQHLWRKYSILSTLNVLP